ncbi:MAG: histidine kinase [Synechococcaceae cyanobacterium RM1_1_27]|nr:histidine kinase [Synechococcaceae cyanobacterium RM1_1_27]
MDPSLTRTSLNLVLFVAKRSASVKLVRQLQDHLAQMTGEYPAQLEVVEIGEQPYLAEHYKLVAMPALVKTFPQPAQVLAGGDLTTQLDVWWPRWQGQVSLINPQSHRQLDCQEEAPHLPASSRQDPSGQLPFDQLLFDQLPTEAALLQMSEEMFGLQQERDRLLKQLHFKDRILAMLMHDLRNPLTAASMAVETTQHQEELDPEFTRYWLEQARQQLRKIDLMTCDILEASRGTNAELVIQVVELEVVDLCMGVLEDFTHRIRAKSLTVETDLPSNLPTVQGDPAKIRQVIVNLLDNAIKYTPTSGIIWVSALHRTAQKIQITVSDTGPGVPVEAQERIFSDTVRLDRDQSSEGYGIGLSLCRRIVRAHYGQIWVEERAGGGSAFHFTLPVYVS